MAITAFSEIPDGFQQHLQARVSEAEELPPNTFAVQPNWTTDDGVATVTLHTAGTGYAANDVLTITQGAAAGATVQVLTVTGGAVATIALLTPGLGYSVANELATTVAPSGGTGCKLNITAVAERSVIDSFTITKDTVAEDARTVTEATVDSTYYKVEIEAAAKEPEDVSNLAFE